MVENKPLYNLYSTERIYRNDTLVSYYFKKDKPTVKKYGPIDIDGERYRICYETGEISNYKKRESIENHKVSVRQTRILLKMLLEMNDFDWFCTLTFDKEKIDRTNDEEVYKCYKKYINNLSHKFPNLRYITVIERHTKKDDEDNGCIHFHLLIGGLSVSELGLVNSGKVCCSWSTKNGICSKDYFEKTKHLHNLKETDGEPIYNITSFAYGFTTASRIVSPERCKTYVSKYIDKAIGVSTAVFKKRFYYSRNLNVPDIVKRLVGYGFESPTDLNKVPSVINNPIVQNSKNAPYLSNYNVLQVRIDNKTKTFIDNGFIPISKDKQEIIFDENQQLKIEDELY